MRKVCLWGVVCLFVAATGYAQPWGELTDQASIGDPVQPGAVTYAAGKYSIESVGRSAGRRVYNDQFYFVYKEMSGSFAISCEPTPDINGEVGLMIRNSIEPNSAHVSFLMSGATPPGGNTNAVYGSPFPYIRSIDGGGTIVDGDIENGFTTNHTGPLRLVRLGSSVHFYTKNQAGAWTLLQSESALLPDPVLTGLAALSWDDNVYFHEVSNLAIEQLPLEVVRSITGDTYRVGTPITVTLTAKARSGQTVNAAINETKPGLSTVTNPVASTGTATVNSSGITWNLSNFTGEATLTYTVTLSDKLNSVSFPGTFNYTGSGFPNSFLGGDLILPKNPAIGSNPAPVQLVANQPVVVQVEQYELIGNGVDGAGLIPAFGVFVDPRLPNGVGLVQVGGSVNHGVIEIPFNVPAGYGSVYAYGWVRGEDGNSDSFHAAVDITPEGTDASRWDSGSGKNWHVDWVSSTTPAANPRPFEVGPGDHVFNLATREDSGSIDYLVFVNDPNFVPGSLNVFTGEIVNPLEELEGLTGLGIFDAHQDVEDTAASNLGAAGGAGLDTSTGVYKVVGSGNDIWNAADNFHFLYKQVNGNFVLEADVDADAGSSADPWVKAMLMARQDLEAGSENYGILIRTDGLLNTQWRNAFGATSASLDAALRVTLPQQMGRLRLERNGDHFISSYLDPNTNQWVVYHEMDLPLQNPIYVGFAVTAHTVRALSLGKFSNVSLSLNGEPVGVDEWALY